MQVVLVEPEIPGNTGNISRLCAANHVTLHLVEPLGFSLEDKYLKRAGLDYWDLLDLHIHPNYEALEASLPPTARYWYATTKGGRSYASVTYREDDVLVFGKETKGLPEELLRAHPERCIRIPMIDEARSLNLSNAVAIISYEMLRQTGFPGLRQEGEIPKGDGDEHV